MNQVLDHQAETLIAGYQTYSDASELATLGVQGAPAVSPTPSIVSFATASSPECIAFSIGASAGGVTTTIAAGC